MRARQDPTGRRPAGKSALIATVVAASALGGCGGSAPPARSGSAHQVGPGRGQASATRPSSLNAQANPVTVRATVLRTARRTLPRSFLGLSFEYWDVPGFDSNPAALRRVFALLRVPGDGRFLLRIGGDSADQSFWTRAPDTNLGPWPYQVTRRWLNTLGSMVRRDHLSVLLDLDLAQDAPGAAAGFARQAVRHLPHGSLTAFEIGNEPDTHHHWVDYHLTGLAARVAAPAQWDRYSARHYAQAFAAYGRALARAAPGVPLAGPATGNPQRDLAWERRLLATDASQLGMITIHRYPLTACAHPNARNYATLARVLSPRAAYDLPDGLSPTLALARRARLPVRLGELNSVTCEGRRGVSNTFASALWAPDALFALWRAGLAGVNIHVRESAPNAAFTMTRAGLQASPLLYGLALFARAMGRRGELARLKVGRSGRSVRLWAVRSGRHLRVLVLNKGPHPGRILLRVPSRRPGRVEVLSAPSLEATTGVTLAGQRLSSSGRWVGWRTIEQVRLGAGDRYDVSLPAFSGALITFRL